MLVFLLIKIIDFYAHTWHFSVCVSIRQRARMAMIHFVDVNGIKKKANIEDDDARRPYTTDQFALF